MPMRREPAVRLRLYYYNKQTSVTADLTTEATLQPSQWGTVQLPLGNNVLKDSSFESGFTATADLGWFKATRDERRRPQV